MTDLSNNTLTSQTLELSSKQGQGSRFSPGELVTARFKPSEGNTASTVKISNGNHTQTFTLSSNQDSPASGSVMLGRLERRNGDLHLRLINRGEAIDDLDKEKVRGLLQRTNLDAEALSSELRRKLTSEKTGQSNSLPPTKSRAIRGVHLEVSQKSPNLQLSDGEQISMRVVSQSGKKVTLRSGENTIQVKSPVQLPKGSQLELAVLKNNGKLKLGVLGVRKTSGTLGQASSVLRSLERGMGLKFLDNLSAPLNQGETVSMEVLSGSRQGTVELSVRGETITAQTNARLSAGTEFSAQIDLSGDLPRAEVVSVRKDTSGVSQQHLNELIRNLGMEPDRNIRNRLLRILARNSTETADKVLNQIRGSFDGITVQNAEKVKSQISQILDSIDQRSNRAVNNAQNLGNLNRSDLKKLLSQLGFQPNDRSVKLAQSVLDSDPHPQKLTLKSALENIQLAMDSESNLNKSKLRSLLFLVKNDLPVKQGTVDRINIPTAGSDSSTNITNNVQLETSIQNASMNTADSNLSQNVKLMGFDLPRQVVKNPSGARDTVQSTLLKTLANTLSSGVSTGPGESGAANQSANELMGKMVKHSMASTVNGDTTYLFVPFEDEGQTEFLKIRFRDEREGDDKPKDEHWEVTIDLELSQLGPLRIQATRHLERLAINFKTKRRESRSIIRKAKDQLVESLNESGFETSVRTEKLEEERFELIDWDLFYGKDESMGQLDVTV